MKNATAYQKKIRKLLAGMGKPQAPPREDIDPFEVLVRAILEADAPEKQVEKALAALDEEFVDVNELRVAPPKEIVDCIGRDFPEVRRKAREITGVLNALFTLRNRLSFDHLQGKPKREIRRHLAELGLSPYAAACMMLFVFEGHAVPVDQTLVECLAMDGYIDPESDVPDVQGFLERIILQKNDLAAHRLFRKYIADSAQALARKRKAQAEARARAEAEAREKAEAEEKARAEAEAREKAAKKKAAAKKKKKAAARSPAAGGKKKSAAKKAPAKKTAKEKAAKKKSAPAKASAGGKAGTKKTAGKVKKAAKKKARKASKKAAR